MENAFAFLSFCVLMFNSGMLTAIYFKLGKHEERHRNHEFRLTLIEKDLLQCGIDLKSNRHGQVSQSAV